ncbi:hypothetical protein OTU49_010805, partial [Cherax quadricarinatus]
SEHQGTSQYRSASHQHNCCIIQVLHILQTSGGNMEHDGVGIRSAAETTSVSTLDLSSLEAEKRKLLARLEEAQEALTCRVCLDRPVAAVFMPCAHLNACSSCSASLTTCPICRSPIHYAAPVIID